MVEEVEPISYYMKYPRIRPEFRKRQFELARMARRILYPNEVEQPKPVPGPRSVNHIDLSRAVSMLGPEKNPQTYNELAELLGLDRETTIRLVQELGPPHPLDSCPECGANL